MSLRHSLESIRSLEQLPGLALELGLEAAWHEVSLHALGLDGTAVHGAAVVGRRARFIALGLAVDDAGSAARSAARALARRGQAALVIALDAPRRLLALAAAHADCPVAAVDLARPRAADLARLGRGAAAADPTPAGLAAGWADALSGQELGARFFAQFRRTLDRFVADLPPEVPARDRHALSLLALTRVLFLYFVQDKGWLDGRPRFLREELDRCLARRRSVDAALLHPLFFGMLNTPPAARAAAARRLGRIPFLNGGLFEPHPLERRWPVAIGNTLWRDAFDELFERFHFTGGGEGTDQSAIGPDMLGRVFEGVMDPDERRAGGVFYTPAVLVDELFDTALAFWLAGRLEVSREAAATLLADPSSGVLEAVRSIAVLDPAAGSGAFLLGALRRLVAIRAAGGEQRAAATRAVLSANLFGVDLNPNAVRLAELRLWLEVLAAESASDPLAVAPLPNLDAFLRQGDSLIEPFQAPLAIDAAQAARVGSLRRSVVIATGAEKARLLRELRRAELAAAKAAVDRATAQAEERIREIVDAARSPGLFGDRSRITRPARRALAALRQERARYRTLARRLAAVDELPWFHVASQFGDVLARGGFDLLIGNPPWVRGEALGRSRRRVLAQGYRWFRSAPRGPGYAHSPDLSVAFLERSVELLAPDGVAGMLLPAKLLTAGYAAAAREELARRTTLLVAEDLTERAKSAFDATVYPMALVARRRAPPANHWVAGAMGRGGPRVAQRSLGGGPWIIAAAGIDRTLARLDAECPRIGARFRARLGVKTGLDRVFLDPPDTVEPEHRRPAIRGRDIRAFHVTSARELLWTHDERGVVCERIGEGARRHLAAHERALRRRADFRDGPFWTLFRTEAAVARHRVVWADLARRLEASVLAGPLARAVPLNTAYVIAAADRPAALRVAVWLNTTWIRALARARATRAASGFARFNAALVESLPLPDPVLHDDALLAIGGAALGGSVDQAAADERGARLLSLTRAEQAALGTGHASDC